MTWLRVTWSPLELPDLRLVRVRRRWFPWPTHSVTWGRTIWTDRVAPSAGHLRHELWHVRQQARMGRWRFLWAYLTGGRKRLEAEAAAVALGSWPQWVVVVDEGRTGP